MINNSLKSESVSRGIKKTTRIKKTVYGKDFLEKKFCRRCVCVTTQKILSDLVKVEKFMCKVMECTKCRSKEFKKTEDFCKRCKKITPVNIMDQLIKDVQYELTICNECHKKTFIRYIPDHSKKEIKNITRCLWCDKLLGIIGQDEDNSGRKYCKYGQHAKLMFLYVARVNFIRAAIWNDINERSNAKKIFSILRKNTIADMTDAHVSNQRQSEEEVKFGHCANDLCYNFTTNYDIAGNRCCRDCIADTRMNQDLKTSINEIWLR